MKLSEITTISTANKFKDNPRTITENQFNHLKEHLNDLGDLGGVVYCHKNKCFVGGNQRSTVFEGAKIEIIETFEKPTKCGTVAHGFVIYKGEKYSYREVIFSKIDFDKACIVANNDGGSFNYDMLANKWDAELLNDWGLDVWQASEDVNLDEFFEEDTSEPADPTNKIVLEYSEEEYEKIVAKFDSMDGSKENIVWKLLGL